MITDEAIRQLNLAPVMLWMSDQDQQITFVNRAWREYTGSMPETPAADCWYEQMHPEDVQPWIRAYHPAFSKREGFSAEFRLQRHDGSFRWMSCRAMPRLDEAGRFLGYSGACLDIHEQRLNEEALERRVSERTLALQQANLSLQQRNHELEQFAYVTSHDLQEPLRKIRIFVDMLLRQEESVAVDAEKLQSLGRIRSSADRMAQLIKDLLTYSRLGLDGLLFTPTDLNTVVLAALRDFDLRIEETGARVHVLSLPIIDAIPLQMSQLFYNLVGNALKFLRPGTAPTLRIFSQTLTAQELAQYPSLEQDGVYYRIVIKDNGIGFNQAFVEKIFVIFQRLNPKERFPGTGIGLAICRKIVQNHRGEIFAFGKENEGAEFHIVLPRNYRAPAL
ncbi:MAG TPA: ATP-binding protein [Dinghuibacter sp.]|uniref:sensor histidine kinase n=1 Tax=Dinghuibacter sp. TaxID=2024697 RepID=UPI002C74AF8F|nr:ATP-binding protein [Dinghuibacter sp.]HTJ14775.1 ATP-binding protein [Dinghuibacter sp.]